MTSSWTSQYHWQEFVLIDVCSFRPWEAHLLSTKSMAKRITSPVEPLYDTILQIIFQWLVQHKRLDITHLVYMPVGHVVLKIYMPYKNVHVHSQYLHKPCKAYIDWWENKYMPRLKNHLPTQTHNHKSFSALIQDLQALGMRARINVEPWDKDETVNSHMTRHTSPSWVSYQVSLYFGEKQSSHKEMWFYD